MRLIAENFFEAMPPGDTYILKSILHNWNDEQALQILHNCRAQLHATGKLLIIEKLMPEKPGDAPQIVYSDIMMLIETGGCERSKAEFQHLFEQADLKLMKTIPTGSHLTILECVPVFKHSSEKQTNLR